MDHEFLYFSGALRGPDMPSYRVLLHIRRFKGGRHLMDRDFLYFLSALRGPGMLSYRVLLHTRRFEGGRPVMDRAFLPYLRCSKKIWDVLASGIGE